MVLAQTGRPVLRRPLLAVRTDTTECPLRLDKRVRVEMRAA